MSILMQRDIRYDSKIQIANELLERENGEEIRDWALKNHFENVLKREVRKEVHALAPHISELVSEQTVAPPEPHVVQVEEPPTPSEMLISQVVEQVKAEEICFPELPLDYVPQPIVLPSPDRMLNITTEDSTLGGALATPEQAAGWIADMNPTTVPPPTLMFDYGALEQAVVTTTNNWGLGNYVNVGTVGGAATSLAFTTPTYTVDGALTYQVGGDGQFVYTIQAPTTAGYTVYATNGTVPITLGGYAPGTMLTLNNTGTVNVVWAQAPLTEEEKKQAKQQQLKNMVRHEIKRRLKPEEIRKRSFLAAMKSPQEQKAQDSLRDLLSENEWRRYVTNGFIMAKGLSGRHYQVFADRRHTVVYQSGKKIASLCIHTDGQCPPSDHVINMKMLIEMDETLIWQGSNITWYEKPNVPAITLNDRLGQVDLNQIYAAPIQWAAGVYDNVAINNVANNYLNVTEGVLAAGTVVYNAPVQNININNYPIDQGLYDTLGSKSNLKGKPSLVEMFRAAKQSA